MLVERDGTYATLSPRLISSCASARVVILRMKREIWSSIRVSHVFFRAPMDHYFPQLVSRTLL